MEMISINIPILGFTPRKFKAGLTLETLEQSLKWRSALSRAILYEGSTLVEDMIKQFMILNIKNKPYQNKAYQEFLSNGQCSKMRKDSPKA